MTPRILIVESERELRLWLRHHLDVLWPDAAHAELEPVHFDALRAAACASGIDLVLFGIHFGDGERTLQTRRMLRRLLRQPGCPPLLVVASGGNELDTVRALRAGARDYLPRPLISAQRLGAAIRRALRRAQRPRRAATSPVRTPTRTRAPFTLPQYSILHQIGDSSRAAVYLAHSAVLGRNVALKVSREPVDSGEELRQFAREHAAISALHHPSVVDIYDYGVHAGHEFIAMEYFPCGDLKMRLRQPLSLAESYEYLQRICAALAVIHTAGMLHRDLKPPNIMLREDGAVVLIDFGLAKQIGSTTHSTAAGVRHGSPYYMSPEQAQGLVLDGRSDLYSAGVILYEMLTGVRPYQGNSAVAIMQQHVQGPRPPLPPSLARLEPLLERFMARNRDQRVASAASAQHELRQHAAAFLEAGEPQQLAS